MAQTFGTVSPRDLTSGYTTTRYQRKYNPISPPSISSFTGDYTPRQPKYSPSMSSGQYTTIADLQRNAQQKANLARIPNAQGLEQKSSALIGQQLAGQVPQDVLDLLAQQSAERGVITGMAGAPASNAAYLRALGLTSIGQQAAGTEALNAAYARNPVAPIPDASQQFFTPYQAANIGLEEQKLAADTALKQEELSLAQWKALQDQWNYLYENAPKTKVGAVAGSYESTLGSNYNPR